MKTKNNCYNCKNINPLFTSCICKPTGKTIGIGISEDKCKNYEYEEEINNNLGLYINSNETIKIIPNPTEYIDRSPVIGEYSASLDSFKMGELIARGLKNNPK